MWRHSSRLSEMTLSCALRVFEGRGWFVGEASIFRKEIARSRLADRILQKAVKAAGQDFRRVTSICLQQLPTTSTTEQRSGKLSQVHVINTGGMLLTVCC